MEWLRLWSVSHVPKQPGKQQLVFYADSESTEMKQLMELDNNVEVCAETGRGKSILFCYLNELISS